MLYIANGLTIQSELDLPFADGQKLPTPADVSIRIDQIPPFAAAGLTQFGPLMWFKGTERFLIQIPQVATYYVERGRDIVVSPASTADNATVRLFLLTTALPALLIQRGNLLLHGSCVRVEDQCIAFIGPSGSGKSTLAAGFLNRGYSVLTDDLLVVTPDNNAMYGANQIELWPDAARLQEISSEALAPVRQQIRRLSLPLEHKGNNQPLPITHIYSIGRELVTKPHLQPITGLARLEPLYKNTYRPRYLQGMAQQARHMQLSVSLAASASMAKLTFPRETFATQSSIERILADFSGAE